MAFIIAVALWPKDCVEFRAKLSNVFLAFVGRDFMKNFTDRFINLFAIFKVVGARCENA
jgi:hypothetical protein